MPATAAARQGGIAKWSGAKNLIAEYQGRSVGDRLRAYQTFWEEKGSRSCTFCEEFGRCRDCPLSGGRLGCHPAWEEMSDAYDDGYLVTAFEKQVPILLQAIRDVETEEEVVCQP